MKKLILTQAFLVSLVAFASAQKGFHAGLEGAFNVPAIINQDAYGQQELDYTLTTGWADGVVVGYNFDNHFGFQLEGVSSSQGQHYIKKAANQPTIYRNVDLNYTHIPLLFKYSGGAQYPTRFYLLAGVEMSMLNKASIYYKDSATPSTIDARNRFNNRDWALVFEFGSDFTLYKGLYLSAGLRFNYGLTDINTPDFRIKNHSGIYNASRNALGGINVGLHYVFGKEK